jgi:hypothetical protein
MCSRFAGIVYASTIQPNRRSAAESRYASEVSRPLNVNATSGTPCSLEMIVNLAVRSSPSRSVRAFSTHFSITFR